MKKAFLKLWAWITGSEWRKHLTDEELFQEIYGKNWRDIVRDHKQQ